jgi:hypothetical protein
MEWFLHNKPCAQYKPSSWNAEDVLRKGSPVFEVDNIPSVFNEMETVLSYYKTNYESNYLVFKNYLGEVFFVDDSELSVYKLKDNTV